MKKSTFSTKHLTTFNELNNEIDWESLLLETPDKTNITPKDFILLAIGTPNKEKESLTMEIIDDKYNTEQDLIYVLVIEGKILKFGKSITTMEKRILSYLTGKNSYRNKAKATNSASNWFILQSLLSIGLKVHIYGIFIPKTQGSFRGWEYQNRVSKEIEKILLDNFKKKYHKSPIRNRQS